MTEVWATTQSLIEEVTGWSTLLEKGVQLDQEPWDIDFFFCFRLQTTWLHQHQLERWKQGVDKAKEQLETQKELIAKIYQS